MRNARKSPSIPAPILTFFGLLPLASTLLLVWGYLQ